MHRLLPEGPRLAVRAAHTTSGTDCNSGRCGAGHCAADTCSDGARDGAETDVDCGGGACPPCSDGQLCSLPSDCTSMVCNGVCASTTCSDKIRNGGGKVTREAGPVKGGTTVIAFITDPDGYKIELIERAEHA